jgi:type I restriction enzyme S subunit
MRKIHNNINSILDFSNWKKVILGNCANIIMGQSPPGESYNDLMIGTPFLQGKAEFGKRYPTNPKYTTDPRKIALKDSVLLSVRAPVGDVNVADRDYCIGRGLCSISLKDGDNEFLYYFLLTQKNKLDSEGSGSTFKSINKNNLHSLELPLPPLEDQQSIARTLRTVQEAQERTEAVIEAAKNLKAAMMRHLFTYGPVPIADRDSVRLKETDIGFIPEDWEIKKVSDLFDSKLGKMLSPKSKTGTNSKPYIRNANVQWGYIDFSDVYEMDFDEGEYQRYQLMKGDILICEGGEIGRTAIWNNEIEECYYQKAIHRLRPLKESVILPDFFSYFMMAAFLVLKVYSELGTTTTIAHLPGVKLKSLPIPLPPIEIQQQIVKYLQKVNNKINIEVKNKEQLNNIFEKILQQSFINY